MSHNVSVAINTIPLAIPAGDQQAFIKDGRVYVPLRAVGEGLSCEVQWIGEIRQVIITTRGRPADSTRWRGYPERVPTGTPAAIPSRTGDRQRVQIVVDERIKEFPAGYGEPFVTAAGRTVVPLRAVGEALDCSVDWNSASRVVAIRSGPQAPPPSRGPEEYGETRLPNQLRLYDLQVRLPDGREWATAELTILGPAIATADQLRAWLEAETPRNRARVERMRREFIPFPDLVDLYLRIGAEYGIRGDLALAQSAKETGYWQFTGDVKPDQNNFCGLWATGSPLTGGESLNGADPAMVRLEAGRHGATFATPEAGVEAHIQHLYAYATTDPLPPGKILLNPRFNLLERLNRRGAASTWQDLNGRWAVPGTTYGQSIIHDYWAKALHY